MLTNDLFLFQDGVLFRGPVRDNEVHRHHAIQIVVATRPFTLRIGGNELRERCVLVDSDVEHELDGGGQALDLLLLIRESRPAERLRESFLQSDRFFVPNEERLRRWQDDSPFPSDFSCRAARDRLVCILDEIFGVVSGDSGDVASDSRVHQACRFIAEQEDLKVSLAEVAAHVGLSEGRLTHLFKEVVGIPLRRYVLWLRTRRAVQAFAASGSLTDAAYAAGFADQAHFSRTFREMFGFSPRDILNARGRTRLFHCSDLEPGEVPPSR